MQVHAYCMNVYSKVILWIIHIPIIKSAQLLPMKINVKIRSNFFDPIPWTVLIFTVLTDQATKWLIINNLAVGESLPATGFFRFTHAWNTGTAFSLFQGYGDILTWVSLAAVAVLTWIYSSIKNPSWMLRVAFGLQFGGAIGNITDRLRLGHVTDFIDVGPWPIFNIADSSIVIGIGMLIFYFWFLNDDSREDPQDLDSDNPEAPENSSITQKTPNSVE